MEMCRSSCLISSILLILLMGCASDYKMLKPTQPAVDCVDKIIPLEFQTGWYDAGVEVMGKHLSGLVLIKNMPDSSIRVVFTNEAGVKFFDFEFKADNTFRVHQVIEQLNRKSVIATLQKDFELILGIPFRTHGIGSFMNDDELFFGAVEKDQTAYFITTKDCASLRRLEWRAGGKRMVTARIVEGSYPSPEQLAITHHTFAMQLTLKRIPKE